MSEDCGRYALASDNTAGVCPEVMAALARANVDAASPYGNDTWTGQVRERVRELFETDCELYFASNGTAANALALAQICRPFHSIVCHQHAHIQTDECGAPEFFSGGAKLLLVGGANGKIDLDQADEIISRQPEVHANKPRAISITQATELGTIYQPDEIAAIKAFARRRDLFLHMDGARLANAIATLGCAAKEITWQAGVDILCFGGTKNGAVGAELIVFFKKGVAAEFEYRLKQAGQLPAKARFLAAQWLALLEGDVWLRNARHANQMARRLAERLQSEAKLEILFPVESNAVFVQLDEQVSDGLRRRGWQFYQFVEPNIYRIMCSWSVPKSDLDQFISDVVCIRQGLSL